MKIQFLKDRIGFNIIEDGKIIETRIFETEKKMYDYLYKKMHTKEYIEFLEL